MKRTRVCFIAYYAYPLFNGESEAIFGGAEVQAVLFGKKLAEDRAYQVDFITGNFGQATVEVYDNVRVHKLHRLDKKGIKYLKGIYYHWLLFYKIFKLDPDLCIQRSAGIQTGVIALYCKIFKKRFIYMTAHEFDCTGRFEKNNGISGKIFGFGLKYAYRVITQSREHQKLLEANYHIRSEVIENSFCIPEKYIGEKKFVLWIARLAAWKQPEKFFLLADKFPERRFVMVAPEADDAGYAKFIKNKAVKIKNLEFIPGVDFERVDEYFKQAKIFINTSTHEGFPNTFVQAAMYATPVVSLNVNPDNFLNEYACGYCAGGDEEKMAEYVQRLLEDKNDWQQKSNNIYQYAQKKHNMRENIIKFKKIIND
jgi:glycosyltransferase involved in cell wall biosynthesis